MLSRQSATTEITMDFSKVEVFIKYNNDSNLEEFPNMADKRLAKVLEMCIYILLKERIRRGCDVMIQNYWTFADEISERNGLVYKSK